MTGAVQWRTVLVAALLLCTPDWAQSPVEPQFEVASVKAIDPMPPHNVALLIEHEKLTIEGATLRQMIGLAYGVQRIRVVDGPEWFDSEQFNVMAKAASPEVNREQIQAMLRVLLVPRFRLAMRHATREMTEFALVLGKKGSKLQEAAADEVSSFTPTGTPDGGWLLVYRKRNLVGLVNTLANFLGSPVRDETGLKGLYDFKLTWQTVWPVSQAPSSSAAGSDTVDSGISLLTAVEQQLGLKLNMSKGLQDVLVVEHAERPSEN